MPKFTVGSVRALLVLGCLVGIDSAEAQTPGVPPVSLPPVVTGVADPRNADDAEAAFRAAAAAAARGDLAAAITGLERVLQTNPDLANIKLELGLLYLRAGNPDLARSYLEVAINSPEAPEEARQRVRTALRSTAGALGRFGASGFVFAGVQYQTNPNGSPSAVSVAGPNGAPILISGDDLSIPRGSDFSANATASVQLRYGLNGQRGNDIVADLTASQSNFIDTTELDATYLNARVGPRFFTGSGPATGSYLQPYVTGTLLALGHARYFNAGGVGAAMLLRPTIAATLSGQLSYERRDYNNSRRRGAASEQTGDYWSGVLELAKTVSPRARISGAGLFERVEARREYWSRGTYGGQIGLAYAIRPPVGQASWLFRLTGTYRHSHYGAPDPLVDPARRRRENRTEIEAGLSIPVSRLIALDLRTSRTWNESNLPNYDYRNTLAAAGVSLRF